MAVMWSSLVVVVLLWTGAGAVAGQEASPQGTLAPSAAGEPAAPGAGTPSPGASPVTAQGDEAATERGLPDRQTGLSSLDADESGPEADEEEEPPRPTPTPTPSPARVDAEPEEADPREQSDNPFRQVVVVRDRLAPRALTRGAARAVGGRARPSRTRPVPRRPAKPGSGDALPTRGTPFDPEASPRPPRSDR